MVRVILLRLRSQQASDYDQEWMPLIPMNIDYVLILMVLLMFPTQWLIGALGIPEPFAVILFIGAITLSQTWLLRQVRCQHCGHRLFQRSFSLKGFVFWPRYMFFRGHCPHCNKGRGR